MKPKEARQNHNKARVAILGTGRVGTDLLFKTLSSQYLEPIFHVGRNEGSEGLRIAKELGVEASADGIEFLKENVASFSYVFDATSAASHYSHSPVLGEAGKFVINLTPAKIGKPCVPSVNLQSVDKSQHVNMITCGGQAALPLVHVLRKATREIDYIEVVSSISSKSAGMATRENIDEYLVTTESALSQFGGARQAKAILNINPAIPHVCMQTTIYAAARFDSLEVIHAAIAKMEAEVREYVPGYEIVLAPVIDRNRVTLSVTVHGRGDFLPKYAGNLDIINCATIAVAEHRHQRHANPGRSQ